MWNKVKMWGTIIVLVFGLLATGYLALDKYVLSQPVTPTPNVYVITPDNGAAAIVIEGSTTIKVGQLARLTVEKSSGKVFKWKILPETDNFQVYDNGRRAVFSSPVTGDFVFIVASANDNEVDVKTFTLKVTNGSPTDPTNPTNPVNPSTGVAGKVYEWAKLVDSANKKVEAGKLAESFNIIAKQIQDGQLTTADQIAEATKLGNRVALGNSLQAWVPFLEQLQKEMRTQAEAGLLVTSEQHAILWRQIAEGLNNVAK